MKRASKSGRVVYATPARATAGAAASTARMRCACFTWIMCAVWWSVRDIGGIRKNVLIRTGSFAALRMTGGAQDDRVVI